MKLNISYPATAQQKVVEIEDERKLYVCFEWRVGRSRMGRLCGDMMCLHDGADDFL
jgi:hypothetical protein